MSVFEVIAKVLQIDVTEVILPVAVVAALLAGFSDARSYRVPNAITVPLMGLGIAYHAASAYGNGWLFALAGFSFGLLILLPFFLLGGIGAGDVKLLAGIGACLGLHDTVAVFLVFGTLASAYSAVLLLLRGRLQPPVAGLAPPPQATSAITLENSRIEEALELDPVTRRWRMVPLATMMAIALLILATARIAPQIFMST